MGRIFLLTVLMLLCSCSFTNDNTTRNRNNCTNIYFNQKPPGETPEIFEPGGISKGFHEHALAISPRFDELFFVMADINYQLNVMVDIRRKGRRWGKPGVASFSGEYKDLGGCFDTDGDRFLFASQRAVDGKPGNRSDLWEVSRVSGGWSEPINIGPPVNTEAHEANPCLDRDGNLYFQTNHDGSWDIYYSEYFEGSFMVPEKVTNINTEYNESDPFISADGSYLLFHSNRGYPIGLMDLYVSFRMDNEWSEPVNLGDGINSPYSDFGPSVSPDGKYLFFSSYRPWTLDDLTGNEYGELIEMYSHPMNGYATLYWVDASVIEKLKGRFTDDTY